jgi:hypothetical protein
MFPHLVLLVLKFIYYIQVKHLKTLIKFSYDMTLNSMYVQ